MDKQQAKEPSTLVVLRRKIEAKMMEEGINYAVDAAKQMIASTTSEALVQAVLPIAGAPVAMGLGLIHMGAGIYSIHQSGLQQKELERLGSHFSELHRLLHDQARVLEILDAKQDALLEGLALMREEIRQGFTGLEDKLDSQEAQRKKELFEEKTYRVFRAYQDFFDMDFVPEEAELLRARADELEGWLIGQMKGLSPREPVYFPWFVALVFARRARIDAFQSKGGPYQKKAEQELAALLADVQDKMASFMADRTVYELTVSLEDIVGGYANLWKGLQRAKPVVLQKSSQKELLRLSAEEALWDDGFEAFRDLLRISPESGSLPASQTKKLRTISDYQWYCAYQEKDDKEFDVHSCTEVSIAEMLGSLGHPAPSTASIKQGHEGVLSTLVLPEYRQLLEQGIREQLGLSAFQIRPSTTVTTREAKKGFLGLFS